MYNSLIAWHILHIFVSLLSFPMGEKALGGKPNQTHGASGQNMPRHHGPILACRHISFPERLSVTLL
jgi:hypothetical protein